MPDFADFLQFAQRVPIKERKIPTRLRASTVTCDDRATTTAEQLVERLQRLTSGELRLLSLAVPGRLRRTELAETLGVSTGNVAAALQRIRRKLAVPRRVDLAAFAQANPLLTTAVTTRLAGRCSDGRPERRQLHLLRSTIDDLAAVAVRARERADHLDRAERLGDDERRAAEVHALRRIVEIVDTAVADSLAVARQPGG